MRIVLIGFGIVLLCTFMASAQTQTRATTADGRTAILYPDGTWEWAESEGRGESDTSETSKTGGENPLEQIKTNCKAEWGSNYRMQKYCIDQQTSALQKLQTLLQRYGEGTEEFRIIGRCLAEWKGKAVGYNYRMAHYCSEQQLSAYRETQ